MIKNNKLGIILSSIVIMLPSLVGLFIKDNSAYFFIMPPIFLIVHLFAIFITSYDNSKNNQSGKVTGLILWIIPAISVVVSATIHLFMTGAIDSPHVPICILMGVLFIILGNYMPKTRQNRTIGIKIKWTLQSENNWNATHRVAGYVWVVVGFVVTICSFMPSMISIAIMFISILIGVLIPTVYSYKFYTQELSTGADFAQSASLKYSKRFKKGSIIALAILFVVIFCILFIGSVSASIDEDSVEIDCTYWTKTDIKYEDIDSLELIEGFSFGTRAYGFSSPRLMVGSFKNAEFGKYTLMAYTKNKTVIAITVNEDVTVFNLKTTTETVKLYNALSEKLNSK